MSFSFPGKVAMKDLVRNPLGIIALFISLIYGIAGILLGVTATALDNGQLWLLVVFVVVFPLIVLASFYRLVTNHHKKLYAPSDFKSDASFLETLTPQARDARLENEAYDSVIEAQSKQVPDINVQPRTPEDAEAVEQNVEAAAAVVLNAVEQRKYVLSEKQDLQILEDLAIARLERDFADKIDRGVSIGNLGISYDGYMSWNNMYIFFEVKRVRQTGTFSFQLSKILNDATTAQNHIGKKFKLILALVYDSKLVDLQALKAIWNLQRSGTQTDVEVRFFSVAELTSNPG